MHNCNEPPPRKLTRTLHLPNSQTTLLEGSACPSRHRDTSRLQAAGRVGRGEEKVFGVPRRSLSRGIPRLMVGRDGVFFEGERGLGRYRERCVIVCKRWVES
jgi:hypothetical protein